MAPRELKGNNLGEKHKCFNSLVKDAVIAADEQTLEIFFEDEGDIENLIKIDVASKKRNLEYILKVLVSDDMLYVSRAIKQCKWLVTEIEYAHIINPEYLFFAIFDKMCSKASKKLLKYIQIHLKDEGRVEEFYNFEDSRLKAVNWLPNCSLDFIKEHIVHHIGHLKTSQLKRLCKKSIAILQIYLESPSCGKIRALEVTSFFLRTETEKYMDLTEQYLHLRHERFSASITKLMMEKDSKRIINKFEKYCNLIHVPTFIKFLKKEDIKEFLIKQSNKVEELKMYHHFDSNTIKSFILAMPDVERFEFVKDIFINKIFRNELSLLPDNEKRAYDYLYSTVNIRRVQLHEWYIYAPFDIAFENITKMIKSEKSHQEKNSMLSVLLEIANPNETHIGRLLQYFKDKQLYAQSDIKYEFLNNFISKVNFYRIGINTWKILEDLIQKDFDDTDEITQTLLQAIIIYKVLHLEMVPISFEKLFNFNTLQIYKDKFNAKENELIFTYLYNFILSKIQKKSWTNNDDLDEWVTNLGFAFKLLKDWDKDLKDYPFLIEEVKRLVKIVNKNLLKTDLSSLYNTKKAWKKYMFEESLHMNLNQSTLLNAIKHDQSLLKRSSHAKTINIINVKPISHFLRKVKIYYSSSLATDISKSYCEELYNTAYHTEVTRGISLLFPRAEMLKTLNRFAPVTSKINDSDVNMETLSLQRHLAKNMHIARPQPSPETVLLYAKGDYLQYALPSVLAIFYNLNLPKSRISIPKLLDSQVSLQKHAIRFGLTKLQSHEITKALGDIWKTTKNSTIRYVLFKGVFKQLCNEKHALHRREIWCVLDMLIDNLTLEENKAVYDLLFEVNAIPLQVRAVFYMKVYPFLKKLCNSDGNIYCHKLYNTFIPFGREFIEDLPAQFMTDLLLDYLNIDLNKNSNKGSYWEYGIVPLISSFVLHSESLDIQMQKYDEILEPILNYCLSIPDDALKLSKSELWLLLKQLRQDVPNCVTKKSFVFPTVMFANISKELENKLILSENYIMITQWKLTVSFIALLEKQKPIQDWNDSCFKIAHEYGISCCSCLKEDTKAHFSYIYTLFASALESTLNGLVQTDVQLEICKALLLNQKFVEAYLVALKVIPKHESHEETISIKTKELRHTILQHPSLEIKIHYYDKFPNVRENAIITETASPPGASAMAPQIA